MNKEIIVREYGCLCQDGQPDGLDFVIIDKPSWHWLKEICLTRTNKQSEFLRLISRKGRECLQVRNYVGILETPVGLQIEIIPKTAESNKQSIEESRALLWKMLSKINNISWTSSEDAHLQTANRPIIEVLISQFLTEVNSVVKRGIRSDYVRIQEEQRFLRGRLDVARQIRRPPSQRHLFDIQYDKYISNRAENRLIHSALLKALNWSRSSINQRLARELLFSFDAIPNSKNIKQDFSEWKNSRDMVYYQSSKPWCQLILSEQSPYISSGNWKGISLLFPMEQLFEKYVAQQLTQQLQNSYRLAEQARSYSLVNHIGSDWFSLRPDIVIRKQNETLFVMDTKWKRIQSYLNDGTSKYGISQADMYQLYAYGNKYLKGEGELFLIYPMSESFTLPLKSFNYTEDLRLWVVPYDLDNDVLMLPNECAINSVFRKSPLSHVA